MYNSAACKIKLSIKIFKSSEKKTKLLRSKYTSQIEFCYWLSLKIFVDCDRVDNVRIDVNSSVHWSEDNKIAPVHE